MTKVLYSAKLSPPLKIAANATCIYAWITGYGRDTAAMTNNVKRGYEGEFSDDVCLYEETSHDHYRELAELLLVDINLQDKEVLDVGCGTGILSFAALEKGAARVVCGELSELMLNKCRSIAAEIGYSAGKVEFKQCDAAELPFDNRSFDAVISGMVLGVVPDQQKAVSEMTRVLRSGGTVAFSTHGNRHYMECADAASRVFTKPRYLPHLMGVRPEYWTLDEKSSARLLDRAGLKDIKVKRQIGKVSFKTPDQAYLFYTSTSGLFWAGPIPAEKREVFFQDVKACFNRRDIRQVTQDVVFASGVKPT